jgi:hypothetical protein
MGVAAEQVAEDGVRMGGGRGQEGREEMRRVQGRPPSDPFQTGTIMAQGRPVVNQGPSQNVRNGEAVGM